MKLILILTCYTAHTVLDSILRHLWAFLNSQIYKEKLQTTTTCHRSIQSDLYNKIVENLAYKMRFMLRLIVGHVYYVVFHT